MGLRMMMSTVRPAAPAMVVAALLAAAVMPGGARAADDDARVDDSYYGNVVLEDDGSFAQEPDLEVATTGGAREGAAPALAPTALRSGDTVRFHAGREGLASSSVLVFDASGRTAFSGSSEGARPIEWNLRQAGGRPAARGIYFYRVFARTVTGQASASAPGRLVIR